MNNDKRGSLADTYFVKFIRKPEPHGLMIGCEVWIIGGTKPVSRRFPATRAGLEEAEALCETFNRIPSPPG
jgi:hypothetical protein